MENNNDPMISSAIVDEQPMDESPEESTWTFYMQDFQYHDDHHQESAGDDDHDDDDLEVSDAFSSSSGRKLLQAAAFTSARCVNGRQLSFKRRKPNVGDDHDLQDTASSPANSPKISQINQMLGLNQMEKDKVNIDPQGKNGRKNSAIDEDDDGKNKQESELKKRGLCLVPLSMLRNYFI